ncbi:RimK family alpha-L-glutamate ligase [Virgibacillus dakarensis]|uniref:ATP-grasp domain-containing protein n=1 Tax=Virgibacillus dakarensis TaxID=1917889 RepID=UPI000B4323BF|nr:RimK family alpha-L-glutamate ligase [Virgibacillus dakarensis]MBT2215157.1 RimK family alpha-L-glutamate ligase [Virgibacillus dakarensis]MTW84209.1 RimK family alpha-L-glutamate ligase [Virgibacillus dakarensis]
MNVNGWIIYNGHLSGNKFLDFAEWFHEAAQKQGIETNLYKNNDLLTYLDDRRLSLIGGNSLPDFVIFTDKDIYLARQLELLGIRVFNPANAIAISDDKIATYQVLAQHHLPIPKTIAAPKIFPGSATVELENIRSIIDQLGFPMIIKEAFGSFGEQVYLVHTEKEMMDKVKEIQERPFVFQEFIAASSGKDMRLQVVGDHVVAAMTRYASNDFRANVTAGGTMEAYQPSAIERKIAVAATKAIGADFAGVDLLFGPDHTPIICEINSNAHIRNMYDCTHINAADFIIRYISETLTNEGRS